MMKQIVTSIKHILKQQVNVSCVLVIALLVVTLGPAQLAVAAGSASLSLSPATGSYNPGNTITVTVVVNTNGNNVNAVQANFSYPTGLLQFASLDYGSSAFSIQAESSGGSGSVRMARGTITPVDGSSVVVGKAKFTVLNNTGAAALTITSGSNVVSSDTNTDILGIKNGATYTVSQPTPPPSSTGGTTTTTPPKTTTTPTSAPKTSTTPKSTPSSTPADTPVTTKTPVAEPVTNSGDAPAVSDSGGGPTTENASNFDGKLVGYAGALVGLVALLAVAVWWLLGRRARTHLAARMDHTGSKLTPAQTIGQGPAQVHQEGVLKGPQSAPQVEAQSPAPVSNQPQVISPDKPGDTTGE